MGKISKTWLPLLGAVLLALLGAAMPFAVSAVQDAGAENLRESRVLDAQPLTLLRDGGVREALQAVADAEQATLPWTGGTRMTEEDALNAARSVLDRLLEEGIVLELQDELTSKELPYGRENMEKRLTVSRTGGQTSALLWLYTCEGAPLVSVYIDDETGCLVRLSAETDASAEPGAYPKMAEAWRIFLSEYYGFELLPGYAEEGVRVGGDGGSLERYLFPLLLDMGNGQPLRLNLALYGPKYLRVSFNAFYPDGFDAALMPE